MYIQLGILFSVSVFFLVSIERFLIPLLKKKTENISLLPLSWGTAAFFIIALILQQVVSVLTHTPALNVSDWSILLLPAAGIAVMPFLYGKTLTLQSFCIFVLCLAGTCFLPIPFHISTLWGDVFTRLMLAGGWTFFILICTELDRVPIEGFILNMAFFLLFLLLSIHVFSAFPSEVFPFLITILTLVLLTLFLFRRRGFFWLSFPMIFTTMFIAGYFFCRLAVMPNGAYVLIMLGYPIMETIIALALNLYLYRRLFPITVPFLTERAFGLKLPPKKVFQKVFYALILTELIGLLGLYSSLHYFGISFVMAIILLYGLFIGFTRDMTKVSLKNVGKDVKNGWLVLWNEFKTVSVKQLKTFDFINQNLNCSEKKAEQVEVKKVMELKNGLNKKHLKKRTPKKNKAKK